MLAEKENNFKGKKPLIMHATTMSTGFLSKKQIWFDGFLNSFPAFLWVACSTRVVSIILYLQPEWVTAKDF